MSDDEQAARDRLASLHAEEQRQLAAEASSPVLKDTNSGQVIDFAAYLRGLHVAARTPAELARAAEEEQARAALPCAAHLADVADLCRRPTRANPTPLVACDARLAAWRALAGARAEADRAARYRTRADLLARAGVPERHLELVRTWSWDRRRQPLVQVRRWHEGQAQALVLAGETGAGKSGAAAWACAMGPRLRPNSAASVLWLQASRLGFVPLYAQDDGPRPRVLWEDLVDAQLLVLDDIGRPTLVKDRTWCDRLDLLLSERMDAGRETIMTANGLRPALEAMFGAATRDRLRAWCTWETTDAPSGRQEET